MKNKDIATDYESYCEFLGISKSELSEQEFNDIPYSDRLREVSDKSISDMVNGWVLDN